jgi:hypothetical protein
MGPSYGELYSGSLERRKVLERLDGRVFGVGDGARSRLSLESPMEEFSLGTVNGVMTA